MLFSTNDRSFRLDEVSLSKWKIEDITARTQSRDFRETPHRSWELRKENA
jgi:hypothetical protein